jgi:2Fe-2S ferredoxin
MPKVTYVAAGGEATTIEVRTGANLMIAATTNGVSGIAGDCGGVLSCATCHVYVDEPYFSKLPPAEGDELSMLDFTAAERTPQSRLCCQILLTDALDGLVVRLPATQY